MGKIIIHKKSKYVNLRYRLLDVIKRAGIPYKIVPAKEGPTRINIPFQAPEEIYNIRDIILEAFEIAYLENADLSFGCCSRFIACSDEMECIHPNHLFALGCAYRKNLDQGKIFYGKNRTI